MAIHAWPDHKFAGFGDIGGIFSKHRCPMSDGEIYDYFYEARIATDRCIH